MMNRGQGPAALRGGQASIDLTTIASYEGTVTKVNIAIGETHPTIEVRLQSGTTALFCLGPWRYLDQIGLVVKAGDSVKVSAANCALGDEEYVVFSITISGSTWILRAVDGSPMWYFGHRG